MRPPRSILDPAFAYTGSAKTNLRKTFARIRREQLADEAQQKANDTEAAAKVAPLQRRKSAT